MAIVTNANSKMEMIDPRSWSPSERLEKLPCYSLDLDPSDPDCVSACLLRDDCLMAMGEEIMKRAKATEGPQLSREAVQEDMQIMPEQWEAARDGLIQLKKKKLSVAMSAYNVLGLSASIGPPEGIEVPEEPSTPEVEEEPVEEPAASDAVESSNEFVFQAPPVRPPRHTRYNSAATMSKEDTLRKDLGRKLTREYKGDLYTLQVQESGYHLTGGKFDSTVESLAEATRLVLGKKNNWSGPKFWKL